MSPELKITRARAALVTTPRFAFWGALALDLLTFIRDDSTPTMATDGRRVFWNARFVESMSHDESMGVIAHEVEHVTRLHHVRRGGRDLELWNVACDYAINPDLLAAGLRLPREALVDSRFAGMSAESIYAALARPAPAPEPETGDDESDDDADGDDDGDESRANGDTSGDDDGDADDGAGEPDADDGADADGDGAGAGEDGADGDGAGQGSGDAGKPADGAGDGSGSGAAGEPADGPSGAGNGSGAGEPADGAGDGPSGPGEASGQGSGSGAPGRPGNGAGRPDPGRCGGIIDAAPAHDDAALAEAAQVAEIATRQAVAIARAAAGVGGMPGHLDRVVSQIDAGRVDWREQLRRFATDSAIRDYSWSRPSRRAPGAAYVLPGLQTVAPALVVAIVDTSASMDDKAVRSALSELESMLTDGAAERVTVVYCDTRVHRVEEYGPGDVFAPAPRGAGGTAFAPAFAWVAENAPDAACIVYLTDCDAFDFGPEPAVPVIWAATSAPPRPLPWGEVIRVDPYR